MTIWSGVSHDLRAFHTDPIAGEGRHEHLWRITTWYPSKPFVDGRERQYRLRVVLKAWEGRDLPAELWSGEALAEHILDSIPDCIGVDVDRPGFHVKAGR